MVAVVELASAGACSHRPNRAAGGARLSRVRIGKRKPGMPRTSLRPHPTSAAAARRFVADVLLNQGFAIDCIERATLLTSEMVTSTVLRTGTGVELVVIADHPMVRVEVRGDEGSPQRQHMDDEAAKIRSTLVDGFSEAWGVDQLDAGGKCTWFEMRS